MPVNPTYPGVYIEEVPSGVRTIVGVATSVTAFVGRARRGPVNEHRTIFNFGSYQREFGGLWQDSTMSYAVSQYFQNGGQEAVIVRVHNGALAATFNLPAGVEIWAFRAANPGLWGSQLLLTVDHDTEPAGDPNLFNLTVREVDPANPVPPLATERFLNVSILPADRRYVGTVISEGSLLRLDPAMPVPVARPDLAANVGPAANGDDGIDITDNDISAPGLQALHQGLWALDLADVFNLLCIPPLTRQVDVDPPTTLAAAVLYCQARRAILLVDPPSGWTNEPTARAGVTALGLPDSNAALFFPRLRIPDPLKDNRREEFVPCGVVAGIIARTDSQRGIWKAPAGIEANLLGVSALTFKMTDQENGQLNPLGINCVRTFKDYGHVVWGARTMRGSDRMASEWKYLPVRRVALHIEESLYRGTQWAVFEPNDEPLWAQLRLNVGAFMHNLYRKGAFFGQSPREAYLVKCDAETTPQSDIDLGIVNVIVGFRPLKPAEFVIIKIQQLAGQTQA